MPPTTAITAAATATGEVPSPTSTATASPVTGAAADSYFPATAPNPDSSTLSLLSTTSTAESTTAQPGGTTTNTNTNNNPTTAVAADARPTGPRRSATFVVAHDPLSREYPVPAHEPGLEELLARKPGVWSLSHYVKNLREAGTWEVEAAERARRFEQVKRDLVAAKERLDGGGKM